MIGEILALSAALCWAIAAVLYKKALRTIGYYATNLLRTLFAFLSTLAILPVVQYQFSAITYNLIALITIGSVFNLVIGDTFYFIGLKKIGVSRTQSISSSYPLFSMIFAALILKEDLTTSVAIGTPLIVGGIALISLSQNNNSKTSDDSKITFSKAMSPIIAAFFWGVGLLFIKAALSDGNVSPIFAIFLSRLSILPFLFLAIFVSKESNQLRRLSKIDIIVLAIAGILALGLGGILLFTSLYLIDASIAIPLSSTSPFLSILLAMLYLKEKVGIKIIVGTLLIITGLVLLTFYA